MDGLVYLRHYQHEQDYFRYYGYHYYWGALGLWGMGSHPAVLVHSERDEAPPPQAQTVSADVHLRSVDEVRGYSVEGADGTLGHVADFVIEDDSWAVRYLVIDVGHWWSGKKVLVAPHWATRVSWSERKVHLDLTRAMVKGSPAWDPAAAVNREYEARLYDYYGRPVYWPSGSPTDAAKPPHTR